MKIFWCRHGDGGIGSATGQAPCGNTGVVKLSEDIKNNIVSL